MPKTNRRWWKFWYSPKHAAHLAAIGLRPLTVIINGERVQYTEADAKGTLQYPTSNFDDFVFLGTADSVTIHGGGSDGKY